MFGFGKKAVPAGVRLPEAVVGCLRDCHADVSTLAPLFEPPRSESYVFSLKGRDAPKMWEALHRSLPALGYWPVILGDDGSLERHRETAGYAGPESPSEIVARANTLSIPEYFARRREGLMNPEDPNPVLQDEGDWPDEVEEIGQFSTAEDMLANEPFPRVWMGLFPTANNWEVPAHLVYGNWNDCPKPEEHVAVLKHWHERYGVELVGAAADIIELRGELRLESREQALELAREQYFYCPDVVDQGVGSIAVLAGTLTISEFWYFWWD